MLKNTLIIALLFIGSYFYLERDQSRPLDKKVETSDTTQGWLNNAQALEAKPGNLSDIVEGIVDSIVNIASIKIVRYQTSPFFNDPFFEHFFGRGSNPFGVPRESRQKSLGSGVIVSSDGHILTNNHVIANASEVMVHLSDQTELQAKVIGTDPHTDLALIKIDLPKKFKPLLMGDSDKLRLAETVLAIGSPFGLGGTVTMGIVSAKGRANVGIVDYEDFIQTDAAINPGNSGGALVNLNGQLVGINTAIYSKSGGYQGIGFAIPVNMAKHVMSELITNGKVERGWIGLRYQNVNSDIAKALGLKRNIGSLVTAIVRNSPGQKSGLKPGDVLLKFNNEEIRNSGHLTKMLSETKIGEGVNIDYIREKKERRTKVVIEALPVRSRTRQR